MTKKDYELVAKAIKHRYESGQNINVYQVALSIATELENDNPRFDRDKFLTACGITDEICPICEHNPAYKEELCHDCYETALSFKD